jgi:hypothetical protein
MRASLVALSQQASGPGAMLQGLDGVPANNGKGRGEGWRQALGLVDQAPPLRETRLTSDTKLQFLSGGCMP